MRGSLARLCNNYNPAVDVATAAVMISVRKLFLEADSSEDAMLDDDELSVVMLKLCRNTGISLSSSRAQLVDDVSKIVTEYGVDGLVDFDTFALLLCYSSWSGVLSPDVRAAMGVALMTR